MKTRLHLLFAFLTLAAVTITAGVIAFSTGNNVSVAQAESPPAPVSIEINAKKPQITPPQIVLHGTFINDQTQSALISADNQEQRWLGLKQYVNADFYLDGIFKDHVLIRDTGKTMALEIRITTGGATQELPEVIPGLPAHAWMESRSPVPGIDRVESNHYRIKRDLVMKELQSGAIFKQVKIVPEKESGFFIERIKEGSMAEAVGLRVGDTIHKINDKPMTNIMDALDLYKNLDSLEKVNVEINRMHQVQNLYYEIN
jgi:type II secretory pathway component PulC